MTPTILKAPRREQTPLRHIPVEVIEFAVARKSCGGLLVARSEAGICAILLDDDMAVLEADLRRRFPAADIRLGGADLHTVLATVADFINRPGRGLDLPLDIRGTPFQHKVWQALREIPSGTTASYTDIAGQVGSPRSVRAVAQACAANPIAVAIPCHRVVRRDGGLSGYRWGIERKKALLDAEARQ